MIPHTQTILADPARGDGHDADGRPGDCWRTCIASVLDVPNILDVPHFVELDNWFGETYRFVWHHAGLSIRKWRDLGLVPEGPEFLIGVGPSPRGDFYHAVVVDRDGAL